MWRFILYPVLLAVIGAYSFGFLSGRQPELGPLDYEPGTPLDVPLPDPLPELGRNCFLVSTSVKGDSPCNPTDAVAVCSSNHGISIDTHIWKFDGRACRYSVETHWPPAKSTEDTQA